MAGPGCRVPSTRVRQEAGRSSGVSLFFQLCRDMGPAGSTDHTASPLPPLSHRLRLTCTEICLDTEKKAGAREPDAGFFCTSVFLTPQPVAAYNKTEIRKSNQNTHPKAKNPRLKEGAARPPGEGWQRGSKGGNACPGWGETQHKEKRTNRKNPPKAPAAERGEPEIPRLSRPQSC